MPDHIKAAAAAVLRHAVQATPVPGVVAVAIDREGNIYEGAAALSF